MRRFSFIVKDENGIHARPAGMIAACAKQYLAKVSINTSEKEADGKRLLSIMSLGAVSGTHLTVTTDGIDEDAADMALKAVCREYLGYDEA